MFKIYFKIICLKVIYILVKVVRAVPSFLKY